MNIPRSEKAQHEHLRRAPVWCYAKRRSMQKTFLNSQNSFIRDSVPVGQISVPDTPWKLRLVKQPWNRYKWWLCL